MTGVTDDTPPDDAAQGAAGDDIEASKAPLIEHLVELRQRLIYVIIGLSVAFVACFWLSPYIFTFLVQPLADVLADRNGSRMIFTGLHEAFMVKLRIAFFGALFLAFPITAIQVWKFVAPGLYKHERRAFLPFLVATPVLFVAGAALVYYLIMPLAWEFLLTQGDDLSSQDLPVEEDPRVAEYLSLVMRLILAFGVSFQLPVALTLLARVGLVTVGGLRRWRKYAVVITFAVAAIITPPDLISQIALGIPILLLYELSILAIVLVERRRARQARSQAVS